MTNETAGIVAQAASSGAGFNAGDLADLCAVILFMTASALLWVAAYWRLGDSRGDVKPRAHSR